MNTLSRVVRCRELLEDGALGELDQVLADLEHDLAGLAAQGVQPRRRGDGSGLFACADCSARFRWPGLLAAHEDITGHGHDVDLRSAA